MLKVLLIVYDNDSRISFFPIGIAYIASACRQAGHSVTIYNQDVYHYSEEHLETYLKNNNFDVIGMGACGGYYQYRKILAITDAIRKVYPQNINSKYRHYQEQPFIIIGAHLVSPDPEYFLKRYYCNAICIGEGEVTIVDLLDAIEHNRPLSDIKGIAYFDNDTFIITEKRPLIDNIDEITMPAYDLFPIDHYALLPYPCARNNDRTLPIISGRGCIFTCNFCYRLDSGFRPRSSYSIINEIKYLQSEYNITYFCFSDELLMSSKKRTKELSIDFLNSEIKFNWSCCGRLNFADVDVLTIMKESGCVFINYGIESFNNEALKAMNKSLTIQQIIYGIENTLKVGISPGLNIIFGNIGENDKCLNNDIDFLLKYDDHSQLRTIRPVTPYPGSPLYYYAIEKGLIKDIDDFYENKHINSDLLTVNFTEMTDDEFYLALFNANKILLENHINHVKTSNEKLLDNLYFRRDSSFRGFRHI
jgi:radical SAM superfamily enzyme YgiQ (UPF0313 family)